MCAAALLALGVGEFGLAARAGILGRGSNVAQQADDATAEAVLHHSLPQIRDVESGLRRSALSISESVGAGIPRLVHQSYALGRRNVALLTVARSNLGQTDGEQVLLGGHTTYLANRTIADGTTDVSYLWEFDGLSHTLHIDLVGGVSRADADRIAASVR